MAIVVVCTGCRSRFEVSEKYAGKSGSCPKCKALIKVPTKQEEVKVHTPAEFAGGGRNAAGTLVIKPIARKDAKWEPVMAAAIAGAVVVVLILTWAAGSVFRGFLIARGLGLLVVSPPLIFAAYTFLRNDELEPYRGRPLYLRTAICAAAYTALWGIFGFVVSMGVLSDEVWNWVFVAPPFLIVGALTALACLDLDFGAGIFHYSFYLLVTVVLRWVAGMGWLWQLSNT